MSTQYPVWNPPATKAGQVGSPGTFSAFDVCSQNQARAFISLILPMFPSADYQVSWLVDPGPSAQPYDNVPDEQGRNLYSWYVLQKKTGVAVNGWIGREIQKLFERGIGYPVTIVIKPQKGQTFFPFHFAYIYGTSPTVNKVTPVEVTVSSDAAQLLADI